MDCDGQVASIFSRFESEVPNPFPTDIKFLKKLIDLRVTYLSKYTDGYFMWLETLLRNPFDLSGIIDARTLIQLISDFCEYYGSNQSRNRLISSCLALSFAKIFEAQRKSSVEFVISLVKYKRQMDMILNSENQRCLSGFTQNYYDIKFKIDQILDTKPCDLGFIDHSNAVPLTDPQNALKDDKHHAGAFNNDYEVDGVVMRSSKDSEYLFASKIVISNLLDVFALVLGPKVFEIDCKADLITLQTLCQFSKIRKGLKLSNFEGLRSCSIPLKRYVMKILSYQAPSQEVLKFYITFLGARNSSLGWTISKCIARYAKYFDTQTVIKSLKELPTLFTNESLWINTAHILGMLKLKGHEIPDTFAIGNSMIFYNVKSEPKSRLVREAGLFLIWAGFNTKKASFGSGSVDEVLNRLFLVALLDEVVQCRRAAASVVFEIIGVLKHEQGALILDAVNFHSVYRPFSCLQSALTLSHLLPAFKDVFKTHLERLFSSFSVFNLLDGYFEFYSLDLNYCLCKWPIFASKQHCELFYSLCRLLEHFEQPFCESCPESYHGEFLKRAKISDLMSHQMFKAFSEAYLKVFTKFCDWDLDLAYPNLFFILDKDVSPKLAYKILSNFDRPDCRKKLISNLQRRSNESYILAAGKFISTESAVRLRFSTLLKGTESKKKSFVFDALTKIDLNLQPGQLLEAYFMFINQKYFPTENHHLNYCPDIKFFKGLDSSHNTDICRKLENEGTTKLSSDLFALNRQQGVSLEDFQHTIISAIMESLEDYSVDFTGDKGSFARLSALEFLISQKIYSVAEIYVVQYLCCKSYRIRNKILSKLQNINEVQLQHLLKHSSLFFKKYRSIKETLRQQQGYLEEEIHFRSCVLNIKHLPAFLQHHLLIGILASFRNSDSYAKKYSLEILAEHFGSISGILIKFLYMKGRYLFLSLFALVYLFEKFEHLKNDHRAYVLKTVENINVSGLEIKILQLVEALKSDKRIFDYEIIQISGGYDEKHE